MDTFTSSSFAHGWSRRGGEEEEEEQEEEEETQRQVASKALIGYLYLCLVHDML